MTELDCTNVDTAVHSLSQILKNLERPIVDLKTVLSKFTGGTSTEEEKRTYPFSSRLLLGTVGCLREQLPYADSVVWFHATRVPPCAEYQDGLLPTGSARQKIFQFLRTIASTEGICAPEDWAERKEKADRATNTTGKIRPSPNTGHDAGPHGFLPREYILKHARYYLDLPEEVREFCSRVGGDHGKQIAAAYKAQTRPAIVKFRSSTRVVCAVSAAIEYVHWKLIGDQLSLTDCPSCGWCGGGTVVPKSDILGVEWIDM